MKLVDIVKRIEASGLDVKLSTDKDGTLFLWGWTDRVTELSRPLFGCVLEGDTHEISRLQEDRVLKELAQAAKHPDAVWRRELDAKVAEQERRTNAA